MAKKIEVSPEVRSQLVDEFELTNDNTVYRALRYESDSPSAKMIRRRALELGGREWMTTDEVASTAEGSPKNQGEEDAA